MFLSLCDDKIFEHNPNWPLYPKFLLPPLLKISFNILAVATATLIFLLDLNVLIL